MCYSRALLKTTTSSIIRISSFYTKWLLILFLRYVQTYHCPLSILNLNQFCSSACWNQPTFLVASILLTPFRKLRIMLSEFFIFISGQIPVLFFFFYDDDICHAKMQCFYCLPYLKFCTHTYQVNELCIMVRVIFAWFFHLSDDLKIAILFESLR